MHLERLTIGPLLYSKLQMDTISAVDEPII